MPVVHCKKSPYDVYIGRPGPWGNPFEIGRDGDRDAVIQKYRDWLWASIRSGEVELRSLADLQGKALGCWCAPKPCHGDVLEKASAWAQAKLQGLA